MKKLLVFLTCLLISFSLVGCNQPNNGDSSGIVDGVYSANSKGYKDMVVTVTVTDGKIVSIDLDHKETEGVADLALTQVVNDIIEIQGLGVDLVAGASETSRGIINGVTDAMEQANADVEAMKLITKSVSKEDDKTVETEVVVIGAGGAGLAAAVTANQNGSKVIVLEKMAKTGGNTILSGGALNAVDEGSETALANKDSIELHYTQTYEGGDKLGDPVLIRTLVENGWDDVEWLKDLGMEFQDGTFTVLGGLWPRAHKPVEPVGSGFFKTYEHYINNNDNIVIDFETTATDFIVEDNKVVGVKATGPSGNTITYKASKGVVLASGGFSQNIELRQEVNKMWPDLGPNLKSTNHPGATGDGIVMAKAVNAELVGMEYIQLLPMGDPETGSLSGNIEKAVENRIYVNKEGHRFVDEGARRDIMTSALISQTDSFMWTILDSHDYPTGDEVNNFNESLNDLIAQGRAFKGDTLEDLAAQIKVDPTNLVNAIDGFNKAVAGEKDEFDRTLFKDPIDKGPFYAAPRIPTVHHTCGGVKINEKTQVIDVDGNIIDGLYAAGEVTGGIHGANRLGGNALTDILVFGRIAGEQVSSR